MLNRRPVLPLLPALRPLPRHTRVYVLDSLVDARVGILDPSVEDIGPDGGCGLFEEFDEARFELQSKPGPARERVGLELALASEDEEKQVEDRDKGLEQMEVERSADEDRLL